MYVGIYKFIHYLSYPIVMGPETERKVERNKQARLNDEPHDHQ